MATDQFPKQLTQKFNEVLEGSARLMLSMRSNGELLTLPEEVENALLQPQFQDAEGNSIPNERTPEFTDFGYARDNIHMQKFAMNEFFRGRSIVMLELRRKDNDNWQVMFWTFAGSSVQGGLAMDLNSGELSYFRNIDARSGRQDPLAEQQPDGESIGSALAEAIAAARQEEDDEELSNQTFLDETLAEIENENKQANKEKAWERSRGLDLLNQFVVDPYFGFEPAINSDGYKMVVPLEVRQQLVDFIVPHASELVDLPISKDN